MRALVAYSGALGDVKVWLEIKINIAFIPLLPKPAIRDLGSNGTANRLKDYFVRLSFNATIPVQTSLDALV